jgi:hypothetical protein
LHVPKYKRVELFLSFLESHHNIIIRNKSVTSF